MASMCSSLYFRTASESTIFRRNSRQAASPIIFGQISGSSSITTRFFPWSSRLLTAALISSNVIFVPPFYIKLSCLNFVEVFPARPGPQGQVRSLPGRLNNALSLQGFELLRPQTQFAAVNVIVVRAHRTADPLDPRRRLGHLPGLVGNGQFAVMGIMELFKGTPHPPVFGLH